MSRLKLFLTLAVAGLLAFSGASQSVAAPTSLTVDGAVYTMDYTLLGVNDYQFTLHINGTGYTGGGLYLGSLAFSMGQTFTSFSLLSTPDGLGNWTTIAGGLNSNGCSGSGAPWMCIQNNANSGKGYSITPLASHSDDTYVFEFKGVTLTSAGVDLKAQYVDANNKKQGSLISAWLSPTPVSPVPEPETYAMMLAGLGLLGFTARRRKNS